MKERYFSSKFLSYFYSDDPKTHFDAQSKSLTHDTYAGIYPIDIIESTSGVQDNNGVDIYESDIVNLQGFKKPLVVKHSDTKGFFLCVNGVRLSAKPNLAIKSMHYVNIKTH